MDINNKKSKVNIDVYLGIILMLFSGVFLYESFKMNKVAAEFPKIVLTLLLILSALLFFLGIRKTRHPELTLASDTLLNIKVIQAPLAVYAIIAIYILLIKYAGFFISTILCIPVIMVYYGIKKIRTILLTDIILNLFIYVLFVRMLNVMLP